MMISTRDFETVASYNRRHAGKAWAIVALIRDGGIECADCCANVRAEDPNWSPVFSSDGEDTTCDRCLQRIGSTP